MPSTPRGRSLPLACSSHQRTTLGGEVAFPVYDRSQQVRSVVGQGWARAATVDHYLATWEDPVGVPQHHGARCDLGLTDHAIALRHA